MTDLHRNWIHLYNQYSVKAHYMSGRELLFLTEDFKLVALNTLIELKCVQECAFAIFQHDVPLDL